MIAHDQATLDMNDTWYFHFRDHHSIIVFCTEYMNDVRGKLFNDLRICLYIFFHCNFMRPPVPELLHLSLWLFRSNRIVPGFISFKRLDLVVAPQKSYS